MDSSARFGPWPKGLNTMAPDPALGRDELRKAINVDILTDGRSRQRPGFTRGYASSAPTHSVFGFGSVILFVEGSTLKWWNPVQNTFGTLQTGLQLGARVAYENVNGSVYWTEGTNTGRIDANLVSTPWGFAVPNAPVVAYASGGVLPQGQYQVLCAYATALGEESGTSLATFVTTPSDNCQLNLTSIQQAPAGQGITTINVYVSQANGAIAYYHGSVPVGATTYTIQSTAATGREARNRFLVKPPPGNLLTYRRGRILIAAGSVMFLTNPLNYGLYDPSSGYAMMDSTIQVMRAVTGGVWLVTLTGTYFLRGDRPEDFTLDRQADFSAPMQKAVDILDDNDVAWLSHRGWVRGTSEGELKILGEERVQTNLTYGWAPSILRESAGHRQTLALAPGSAKPPVNATDFNSAF